jgi:hypothetical protein
VGAGGGNAVEVLYSLFRTCTLDFAGFSGVCACICVERKTPIQTANERVIHNILSRAALHVAISARAVERQSLVAREKCCE